MDIAVSDPFTWAPPSDSAWQAMCKNPAKYAPLIERVVGYMLYIGARHEDDTNDPCGHLVVHFDEFAKQTPCLAGLSDDELHFIQAGAVAVIYQDDPGFDVRGYAKEWMRDGGPE